MSDSESGEDDVYDVEVIDEEQDLDMTDCNAHESTPGAEDQEEDGEGDESDTSNESGVDGVFDFLSESDSFQDDSSIRDDVSESSSEDDSYSDDDEFFDDSEKEDAVFPDDIGSIWKTELESCFSATRKTRSSLVVPDAVLRALRSFPRKEEIVSKGTSKPYVPPKALVAIDPLACLFVANSAVGFALLLLKSATEVALQEAAITNAAQFTRPVLSAAHVTEAFLHLPCKGRNEARTLSRDVTTALCFSVTAGPPSTKLHERQPSKRDGFHSTPLSCLAPRRDYSAPHSISEQVEPRQRGPKRGAPDIDLAEPSVSTEPYLVMDTTADRSALRELGVLSGDTQMFEEAGHAHSPAVTARLPSDVEPSDVAPSKGPPVPCITAIPVSSKHAPGTSTVSALANDKSKLSPASPTKDNTSLPTPHLGNEILPSANEPNVLSERCSKRRRLMDERLQSARSPVDPDTQDMAGESNLFEGSHRSEVPKSLEGGVQGIEHCSEVEKPFVPSLGAHSTKIDQSADNLTASSRVKDASLEQDPERLREQADGADEKMNGSSGIDLEKDSQHDPSETAQATGSGNGKGKKPKRKGRKGKAGRKGAKRPKPPKELSPKEKQNRLKLEEFLAITSLNSLPTGFVLCYHRLAWILQYSLGAREEDVKEDGGHAARDESIETGEHLHPTESLSQTIDGQPDFPVATNPTGSVDQAASLTPKPKQKPPDNHSATPSEQQSNIRDEARVSSTEPRGEAVGVAKVDIGRIKQEVSESKPLILGGVEAQPEVEPESKGKPEDNLNGGAVATECPIPSDKPKTLFGTNDACITFKAEVKNEHLEDFEADSRVVKRELDSVLSGNPNSNSVKKESGLGQDEPARAKFEPMILECGPANTDAACSKEVVLEPSVPISLSHRMSDDSKPLDDSNASSKGNVAQRMVPDGLLLTEREPSPAVANASLHQLSQDSKNEVAVLSSLQACKTGPATVQVSQQPAHLGNRPAELGAASRTGVSQKQEANEVLDIPYEESFDDNVEEPADANIARSEPSGSERVLRSARSKGTKFVQLQEMKVPKPGPAAQRMSHSEDVSASAKSFGEACAYAPFGSSNNASKMFLDRSGMDEIYSAVNEFACATLWQLAQCARHVDGRHWIDREDVDLFCAIGRVPLDYDVSVSGPWTPSAYDFGYQFLAEEYDF